MNERRCDDCLLHSNMVREDERADKKIDMVRKELCAKISKVETNVIACKKEEHEVMWRSIDKKLPRWVFVSGFSIILLIFTGFGTIVTILHESQSIVEKRVERTDVLITTELSNIKDAIKDVERAQRRDHRNNP